MVDIAAGIFVVVVAWVAAVMLIGAVWYVIRAGIARITWDGTIGVLYGLIFAWSLPGLLYWLLG